MPSHAVLGASNEENLATITLVGHSHPGLIITRVAQQAHQCIAQSIYVDAFPKLILPANNTTLKGNNSAIKSTGSRTLPAADALLPGGGLFLQRGLGLLLLTAHPAA